ncbi:MAG TPA: hypothetical protein VF828_03225 [Patescibacteria group bacterium]
MSHIENGVVRRSYKLLKELSREPTADEMEVIPNPEIRVIEECLPEDGGGVYRQRLRPLRMPMLEAGATIIHKFPIPFYGLAFAKGEIGDTKCESITAVNVYMVEKNVKKQELRRDETNGGIRIIEGSERRCWFVITDDAMEWKLPLNRRKEKAHFQKVEDKLGDWRAEQDEAYFEEHDMGGDIGLINGVNVDADGKKEFWSSESDDSAAQMEMEITLCDTEMPIGRIIRAVSNGEPLGNVMLKMRGEMSQEVDF